MKVKQLDIVTSALNEEKCLPELYARINSVMQGLPNYTWKLTICDNGSTDNSWNVIQNLGISDPRVFGVRMSRTFPLDSAYTCGMDLASADVLIIMASDLQDPPELIPELLAKFEDGYEQVITKVINRGRVPLLRRFLTYCFYSLADKFTNKTIPRGITDFRLLSKNAYLGSRLLRERNRFLRGLFTWSGYKTYELEFNRMPRYGGESVFLSMKLQRVIKEAINSILAHTAAPLIWVSILGASLSIFSFGMTVLFSVIWLTQSVPFAGFGTIVGLISLGFSSLLFAIGILSQYVALIYEEVKSRPIYLISETTKT
jgi:glycosyltransferase involved in cell wall biosynthesis